MTVKLGFVLWRDLEAGLWFTKAFSIAKRVTAQNCQELTKFAGLRGLTALIWPS